MGALLWLTATDYQTFFNGAQFVDFLLGPTTVALGAPLYRNLALVRRNLLPMAAALIVGLIVAVASAVGIGSIIRDLIGTIRESANVVRAGVDNHPR